jgi:hypothetical protein
MVFVHCLGERSPDHRRLLDVNPHHQWRQSGLEPMPQMLWSS